MNYGSSNQESRSEMRGKRRRTNIILNLLIVLVILLIIIVSAIIFLGGNDEKTADQKVDKQTENKQDDNKEHAVDSEKAKEEKKTDKDKQSEEQKDNEQVEEKESDVVEKDLTPEDEEDAVVTVGDSNKNLKKTIENASWKPIGTSQTGEHTSVFAEDSVDWMEMLQAMTYATGVEQSDMTVWFLGNNGHNRAVGTISSKGTQEKYRVYIDWVDGQGWKPIKVEELNEIEKNKE